MSEKVYGPLLTDEELFGQCLQLLLVGLAKLEAHLYGRSSQEAEVVAVSIEVREALLRLDSGHVVGISQRVNLCTDVHARHDKVVKAHGHSAAQVPCLTHRFT